MRRLTGRAERCGRVWDGRDNNLSHTASGTAGSGVTVTGSISTRAILGVSSPALAPVSMATTSLTAWVLKNGRMQSTALSRSRPGIRRALGVRTRRPRSWVMWVLSVAGRNDTITSARGQSHPVEMASLATSTRHHVASWTRSGSM